MTSNPLNLRLRISTIQQKEVMMKKQSRRKQIKSQAQERVDQYTALVEGQSDVNSRVAMIQALIPIALLAVEDMLQAEVTALAGKRYQHGSANQRWGSNPGSVFLGDQKASIRVPRVRNSFNENEIPLENYQALQNPQPLNETAFVRLLQGISCRDYKKSAFNVPETFGISKSRVSERFIELSAERLKILQERDLSQYDFIAVIIDGKTFAEHELISALGITMNGEKIVLGFIEAAQENHYVCIELLKTLQSRGLKADQGLLFVVDGAKGLHKGIKAVFGKKALIQRCQWHKRENVVSYLPKNQQASWRKRLQQAYKKPTYKEAKQALMIIHKELEDINLSAASSLEEGLEETLTLHKLGVFPLVGTSLKTTNLIESIHSQIERYTKRITY